MPDTDEDEDMTTLRVPASRAGSATLRVPVTLTALVVSGFWMERGAEGRTARWDHAVGALRGWGIMRAPGCATRPPRSPDRRAPALRSATTASSAGRPDSR